MPLVSSAAAAEICRAGIAPGAQFLTRLTSRAFAVRGAHRPRTTPPLRLRPAPLDRHATGAVTAWLAEPARKLTDATYSP